jgi:hypothetical protein
MAQYGVNYMGNVRQWKLDRSSYKYIREMQTVFCRMWFKSHGSTVSMTTGYGVDGWGIGVRVLVVLVFTFHIVRTSSVSYPASYPVGTGGSFPGVKASGTQSWQLTSNYCRGQENVDPYIHSPIRLHGVVCSYLSKGTTLPLLYSCNLEPG